MKNTEDTIFKIKKDFIFKYKKQFLSKFVSFLFRKKSEDWVLKINADSNDLIIKKGFIAVLGESGAGKSTFVSILSGFEKISKKNCCQIDYFDNNKFINYASKDFKITKKQSFGFIFQRCYESKSLNAFDNVALPLFNKHYPGIAIKKYCSRLLEALNLSHLSKSPANELSGGQLTRIGILRGIAQTPQVIFADEPANNLDEQNAGRILNILKDWREQTNGTVIMVTHHLDHAFRYADQIIIFKSVNQNCGEIIFQKTKSEKEWTDKEKTKIRFELKLQDDSTRQFPEPLEKKGSGIFQYSNFLFKMAWKNISSKADGSRSISLITLCSFLMLFFIIFSGNLLINWFTQIDQKKNNASYLRQFEIQVVHPPGLSKEIQSKINETTVKNVSSWLQLKRNQIYNDLEEIAITQKIKPPSQFFSNQIKPQFDFQKILTNQSQKTILAKFQEYSFYLSKLIQKNSSNINLKILKVAEKITKKLIRISEFLLDIELLDGTSKICNVYPRWESGPEFVKKNGKRANFTTTMRWLDYRDPLFNDPRIKYLRGADFRFDSNNDEGIIIDKETLVNDLGYDIDDTEIKILYWNMEQACVPVKAVVEHMPESNKYQALTTFTFGEKLRSTSHHCDDKKLFFQFHATFPTKVTEEQIKKIFDNENNIDQYNNIKINYNRLSENKLEIYCDYENAKIKKLWMIWLKDNFLMLPKDSLFDKNWEVPEGSVAPPPYTEGTVYTFSKNTVRALGEYLSQAFQEDEDFHKRCFINAYGYEHKIQFAKQSESIVLWIKLIGVSLFAFLFLIFLGTNMMVNIRNKASEIAIFQAMGGSLLSLLCIYNIQMFIIVSCSAITAFCLVYLILPYIKSLFIIHIIHAIWKQMDEQREAITAIAKNGFFENLKYIFEANQFVFICCLLFMLIIVSFSIIYVKLSPNYSVTKILKER